MKHYLINDFLDESPKVCFYELLDEREYRLYMFAKLNLKSLEIWGPAADFDVLQFEPIEVSDMAINWLDNRYCSEEKNWLKFIVGLYNSTIEQ